MRTKVVQTELGPVTLPEGQYIVVHEDTIVQKIMACGYAEAVQMKTQTGDLYRKCGK